MDVKVFSLTLLILFLSSAPFSVESGAASSLSGGADSQEFKDYWYSGKAEITSYTIEQARYGELHDGYAVLVFVTEDFSLKKQVKLDDPLSAGNDAVKVLKLNKIKKFNTGIYQYSMMDSIFTAVHLGAYPNTLKVSSSSQEWCGNTGIQLNLTDKGYKVRAFSYFESEGDREFDLERVFLEDEVWTRIRLAPESLPVGKIKLIPGTMASRLTHREPEVESAETSLAENPDDPRLLNYRIEYPGSSRSMVITFEKSFPYKIVSWEETYVSGFGKDARKLTTRAVRNKSLVTDYWNKNRVADLALRKELGI